MPTAQPQVSWFSRFATRASHWAGHRFTFAAAVLIILVWAVTGPLFDYNNTWQLVINTATTIVTFLMVFLIQNSQNRDAQAIQVKLDEIIRALKGARNELMDLEDLDERELKRIRAKYAALAEEARQMRRERGGEHVSELEAVEKAAEAAEKATEATEKATEATDAAVSATKKK
jgi:low affinity Fe/Cu permease